jgi:glycerol-3-phosphate dehydrogenase
MDRQQSLSALRQTGEVWDIAIIGGGASGLGVAVDAASRGYRVCLLEQSDFAKGTSSRSTKIIHGGVRYLKQGNISLVRKALDERATLLRNAPHVVSKMRFVLPSYRWWESTYYGAGLRLYDFLARGDDFPACRQLSRDEVVSALPTIDAHRLRGGVQYWDGQFDDARLAINLATTATEQGAAVTNYVQVTGLCKTNRGTVCGIKWRDVETDRSSELLAKVVVNATGPFVDSVLQFDKTRPPVISPSQGIHLVFDRSVLPSQQALMVPKTDDGRVLFAIPWHDVVVAGTTDTLVETVGLEPIPQVAEVDFILKTLNRYLDIDVSSQHVRSVFAGIRPLVRRSGNRKTASISRDHSLWADSTSQLVTIAGGKWTTYRQMAEETVNLAAQVAKLPPRPCGTKELAIHGKTEDTSISSSLAHYGSDAAIIEQWMQELGRDRQIHADLKLSHAEISFACRHEMARTIDDILARRSRSLLINARAAIEAAPDVASIMAGELDRDESWISQQIATFSTIAEGYVCHFRQK